MAGGGDDDPDAVLAFLLGSTPSLDATSETDSMPATTVTSRAEFVEVEAEYDVPELEPEIAVAANATAEASRDWNAIMSCESESETAQELQATSIEATPRAVEAEEEEDLAMEQGAGEICKEDPRSERSLKARGNNVTEAEHEDDCAAPTSADVDDSVPQEGESLQSKEEKKQQQRAGGHIFGVVAKSMKTTKAHRGSVGTRAGTAVSPVTTGENLVTETELKRDGNVPAMEEVLFVGCVATMLVAYLVACVYSFFHPLEVPLPDYEELYSAYDISHVSVHIVNPVQNSQITPQGILFEWKLANFPVEALHLYGAEVFRYQVSLDDEVITTEVGFLALQEGEEEPKDTGAEILNRTVHFPIPLRKFTHDDGSEMHEQFKLHLEATIPIPGLIGELKTYEQDVYVRKPAASSLEYGVHLTLTSPLDGATFELDQSIVLEYTAVNVREMEVLIDDTFYFRKTYVSDGNLLLRKLGVGPHKFAIRAVDERNEIVASSEVHVDIIERLDANAA